MQGIIRGMVVGLLTLGILGIQTTVAQVINGVLLSTGVDASGDLISFGTLDDDWRVVTAPVGASTGDARVISPLVTWFNPEPSARWISTPSQMTGQESSPAGDYTYERQFVIAKASGTKFEISGSYGSDNTTLKVLLNGNLLAMNGGGFTVPWPSSFFSDNQDFFVDGPNTLQVIVNNAAGEGLNPTGFVMRGSVVAVVEGVGGSVAGISPTKVICENVSQRRHTVVEVVLAPGARSWDCEAAGLVVSPGDTIKQTVTGTAD